MRINRRKKFSTYEGAQKEVPWGNKDPLSSEPIRWVFQVFRQPTATFQRRCHHAGSKSHKQGENVQDSHLPHSIHQMPPHLLRYRPHPQSLRPLHQ